MKGQWPVIGNETLGKLFLDFMRAERLPPAMAFIGPAGLGKETAAVWVARQSICVEPDGPCDRCENCRQTLAGIHDRLTIVRSSAGSIKIEEIRQALDRFAYVFDQAAWLVIVAAERLTESAQNVLLKFLEEPPPHINVILTLPDTQSVRPTVLSRLSVWRWQRVSVDRLRREFPTASAEDISQADGRPGRLVDILADDGREARRIAAAQGLAQGTWASPIDFEDAQAVEQWYIAEEQVLRQWLHQGLGLKVSSSQQNTWSVHDTTQRLARYVQRRQPSWLTVSPRTLYAHLHVA